MRKLRVAVVLFLVLVVAWFAAVVSVLFLLYGLFRLPSAFRRAGEDWLRERNARDRKRIL